jgi:prophage antirepressor-like protein
LGKERVTSEILHAIRKQIDTQMCPKILKDTKATTTWIYEEIKTMCKEENNA